MSQSDTLEDRNIGNYQILRELGLGDMGEWEERRRSVHAAGLRCQDDTRLRTGRLFGDGEFIAMRHAKCRFSGQVTCQVSFDTEIRTDPE